MGVSITTSYTDRIEILERRVELLNNDISILKVTNNKEWI